MDYKKMMWFGVRALRRRRRRGRGRGPFWGEVADFFGVGCMTAWEVCEALGVDTETGDDVPAIGVPRADEKKKEQQK